MSYGKEIFIKSMSIMQERKLKNEDLTEKRRDDFFKLYPQVLEIEKQISKDGSKGAQIVLEGKNVKEEIEKLKDKNLRNQAKIALILKQAGYDVNYLEPFHDCPVCKDTGYIEGRKCECLKLLMRNLAYDDLNNLSPLNLCSFDKFLLNYYEKTESKECPFYKMQNIYNYCREYAYNFSNESSSILMQGGTGLGKTHLALSIASEAINRGFGVIYTSAPNIIQKLEKERFSRDKEEETLQRIIECDLFILDDLGTEFSNQFTENILYNIFNTRVTLNKPIIISTNLNFEELAKQYSARFTSRIMGHCVTMKFVGKDIRFLKKRMAK